MSLKRVVIGQLGTQLDAGQDTERWERWRPSVSLFQHEDLLVERFELLCSAKSLSLAQNLAIQRGEHIDSHYILVSDLAESTWDWSRGEPPENDPAYYLRYNKSFSRMGGTMRYVQADNRDLLLNLTHRLGEQTP